MGGEACVVGSWPSAGAAAPRVKPPANVAPLFRSSRRLKRFEPIGLSFADEPKRKSLPKSRVYARLGAQSSKSGVPVDLLQDNDAKREPHGQSRRIRAGIDRGVAQN